MNKDGTIKAIAGIVGLFIFGAGAYKLGSNYGYMLGCRCTYKEILDSIATNAGIMIKNEKENEKTEEEENE